MPTISVIVPVYKVEQYLDECVQSILNQTFRDFELILVDDGSPDNCGAMCDSYAQKDPRVRVIHQENQGLSGARNSGIDVAQGEFITFIDSDDLVSPDYIEVLYSGIITYNADVSCCKMKTFSDGEDTTISFCQQNVLDVKQLPGREAALSIYNGTGEVGICACGKLYRNNLFYNHRFPVGRIHEDQAIVPIILYEANCVVSVDSPNYYYRTRPDSITQKTFKANRFDNIMAIDTCIAYFQRQNDEALIAAAKKIRKKVNALLVILADSENAHDEIPREYQLSKVRAIYYLYKFAPDDTYSWYMSKLYPRGIKIHAYALKIRRMLRQVMKKA